jgi:hypothetical protein
MYQRDRSDAAQGRKGQRWFMVWLGSSLVYAPHDTHCAQESQQATPLWKAVMQQCKPASFAVPWCAAVHVHTHTSVTAPLQQDHTHHGLMRGSRGLADHGAGGGEGGNHLARARDHITCRAAPRNQQSNEHAFQRTCRAPAALLACWSTQ